MSQQYQDKLIHVFVSSPIDYCNSVFTGLTKKSVLQLQLIQNAAAGILTKTRKIQHITQFYNPSKERVYVKTLLLVYKSLNGLAPQYIKDLLLLYQLSRSLRSSGSGSALHPQKQTWRSSIQLYSVVTSVANPPIEPPELALSESESQKVASSRQIVQNKSERNMNTLPSLDEIMAPGYHVPFITPQSSLIFSDPNQVPSEDFYPTNTMNVDWGSGDYLETMSFFNTDNDDYSLVTRVLSDPYDMEDDTEMYDTSFPSRVGISPSSRHPGYVSSSSSLMTPHLTVPPHQSINPSSLSTKVSNLLQPTDVAGTDAPDVSDIDWGDAFTIRPTDVLLPDMNSLEYYTTQLTKDSNASETGAEYRQNVTEISLNATVAPPSTDVITDGNLTEGESSSDLSGFGPHYESTTIVTTEITPQLSNASESFLDPSIIPTYILDPSSSVWGGPVSTTGWFTHTLTIDIDSALAEVLHPSATSLLPEDLASSSSLTDVHWCVTESFDDDSFATEQTGDMTLVSNESIVSITTTTSKITTAPSTTSRQYLCNVDHPAYLTKTGFPSGVTVGFAKSQVRDILKVEFNKSVELQVVSPPPQFVFRVVSGPVVYTAISVINALRRSARRFLYVSPNQTTPDQKYQVHTVLQFIPGHVDMRYCSFFESVEKGLIMAFAEVRRRSKESTNFTIHILNITTATNRYGEKQLTRQPVDITFTVSGSRGYLMGSKVSNALMKLTMVEFSYYIGFPVLQIAEPFHYPELNTSQLLRSSWVRTVLLGVLDKKMSERTFQANMERRVALLLGEAMGQVRRVKRATTVGNSSVQVAVSRLEGADNPAEMVYFVEGHNGQRMPAVQTANLLNSLDVQRAAIILGYRVQGVLAQPVEKLASSPSNSENNNMWIVIGVVVPLLVVVIIISILYWKLCRTDKLEFQPDAMTTIQQRQKLQAPSVKGFDFAKLHLGQQSKDDVMVIQEPALPGSGSAPLAQSIKDGFSPSENGEVPTPKSKTSASSTKASRGGRRRERISPSDGDSVVSDHSSEREPTEENPRAHATPSDSKQTRKAPINVLNGPPPMNGAANEQLSSASIFEHVDRMSRATDASRRLPNKVQLIAMQPMPVPPLHSQPVNGKPSDPNQMNKEIQAALRHKSEIEHHRNKIRLRAKRKGHYDFPAMDDMIGSLSDTKEQDRIYQKAQTQIDKILDPDNPVPAVFMDSKKSGRGRRSPKQRLKDQLNGGLIEADKDHLITEDSDAVYRKCPGVNNVAYVSDPDQGPSSPQRSPSPTDDVFLGPASSPPGHAPPPPPYLPPQPSIEEARQQMHSLLDDAFALVSPTSQSSTAGITLPGVNSNPQGCSPPGRGPRAWGPSYQPPFPGRFTELGVSSPAIQGLTPRQGLGSSYLPPGEAAGLSESLQPDSLFSSRGLYAKELPSSARPRPVGGTTGAQLHHLTQVGLSSRMNGYPAGIRMHRSRSGDPTAPPAHLDTSAAVAYLSSPPPLDTSPPTHSSASLIKAIREELLRLSQKQAAVSSYHS
uniref:Si:ch211-1e14.1 n=1 Tax=Xiphophorus couchianus TaxID=32473 RepID=A0A3B5LGV4_9TELE